MKATIKAILKTRSPLHIAHPDSIRMNNNGGIEYGDKGFPCTAVQKMRVALAANEPSADGERKSNSKAYPVIAANNLAGRLRRHAALHVLSAIKDKNQKVTMHAYSVLQCGASTGKPDSNDMTYAEYKMARDHAYFGLMGGGPKMFKRNLRIHNASPITEVIQSLKGPLAHPQSHEFMVSDRTRFTALWGFRRVDDLRELHNIEMAEQTIEQFHAEYEKRQALILEEKGTKEDEAESGETSKRANTSTKTYSAIEFVVPGVLFDITMELNVRTDAQMGLYLESLDSFAKNERLGGYTRNGFGVFSFENVQMTLDDGSVINLFNNWELDRSNPMVSGWLKAWSMEAQAMNVPAMEKLIAVKPKAEKKTKAKDEGQEAAGKGEKKKPGKKATQVETA